MKKTLHFLLLGILVVVAANTGNAQSNLAPDQNPNYSASRDKYLKMADSINAWHGTTPQETYKAIDYLEDKRLAKEARIAYRRELRLERARNGYGWGNSYYGNDGYYNSYNNYIPSYNYNYGSYRYGNRGYHRNNFTWNVLPWVLAAGLWYR
jgi:hypothetical protein